MLKTVIFEKNKHMVAVMEGFSLEEWNHYLKADYTSEGQQSQEDINLKHLEIIIYKYVITPASLDD